MTKGYRLDTRITLEQKRRLDEVASSLGVSHSEVVRQLLERVTVAPALAFREESR